VGAIAGRPRGDAVGGAGAEGPHPMGPSGPVIGMDLGGTYLRAALADEYGRVVLKRRVETLAREGREAVLGRVVALLNEVKGEAGARGPRRPLRRRGARAPRRPGCPGDHRCVRRAPHGQRRPAGVRETKDLAGISRLRWRPTSGQRSCA
jgi:hypothetical protein